MPQVKAQPMPKMEKIRQDVVGKKRGSGAPVEDHLPSACSMYAGVGLSLAAAKRHPSFPFGVSFLFQEKSQTDDEMGGTNKGTRRSPVPGDSVES